MSARVSVALFRALIKSRIDSRRGEGGRIKFATMPRFDNITRYTYFRAVFSMPVVEFA